MRVVLTRDEDANLPHETRTAIANQNKADLFVSLHLNSAFGPSARGAETYFLSATASDERAAQAAEAENRSAVPGGGEPQGDDPLYDLQLILWDLAQTHFLEQSQRLATLIQGELNSALELRDRGVKQAPFLVLMGAAMPAVLVEVGFISNPEEERRLQDPAYRAELADALVRAIGRYKREVEGASASGGGDERRRGAAVSRRALAAAVAAVLLVALAVAGWWWLRQPGEETAPRRARARRRRRRAAPGGGALLPRRRHQCCSASAASWRCPTIPKQQLAALARALVAGPNGPGMESPLPPGVEVRGVSLGDGGVVYVDLVSEDGAPPPASGSNEELLRVYSLVDTLVLNVAEARSAVLLWNGVQPLTFSGHVDLSRPLLPDSSLLAPASQSRRGADGSCAVSAIGVFDSGIGGLTVVAALRRRLPDESIVYLGDTARLPYGSKSPETVTSYTRKNVAFLFAQGVKAVVVACNTASALALPNLEVEVPVWGVIEPGARRAAATTSGHVGVIATESTVRSDAYRKALLRIEPTLRVDSLPCPLFVPLVEEGWHDDPVTEQVARALPGAAARRRHRHAGPRLHPLPAAAPAAAARRGSRRAPGRLRRQHRRRGGARPRRGGPRRGARRGGRAPPLRHRRQLRLRLLRPPHPGRRDDAPGVGRGGVRACESIPALLRAPPHHPSRRCGSST